MADEIKEEPAKPPKKGGGFKRVIMLLVLVMVVAGAGIGGMAIGKKQGAKNSAAKPKGEAEESAGEATQETERDGAEPASEEHKKEAHGERKEGESRDKSEARLTFDLEKLTVNLADPTGRRYLQTTLQLHASSTKALKEMEANKAPLTDATLTLLATKTREDLQSPADWERLKRELLTRYEGIISPKSIENIYITQRIFQ